MSKSKKTKIVEALEAKGLSVEDIEWIPHNNALWGSEGGWFVHIDEDKTPLRHVNNPLMGGNFDEIMKVVGKATLGIDFCPNCGIGIDHHEERMGFCENCRTDFKPLI